MSCDFWHIINVSHVVLIENCFVSSVCRLFLNVLPAKLRMRNEVKFRQALRSEKLFLPKRSTCFHRKCEYRVMHVIGYRVSELRKDVWIRLQLVCIAFFSDEVHWNQNRLMGQGIVRKRLKILAKCCYHMTSYLRIGFRWASGCEQLANLMQKERKPWNFRIHFESCAISTQANKSIQISSKLSVE